MKALALAFALVLAAPSLAATPTTRTTDSLSSIAGYKNNPYQYRYGSVKSINLIKENDRTNTNLVLQPIGTYLLFTESVTLCGNETQKLDFNTFDTVVLVFSKLMHRRGCYDLLRIDVIQKARAAGQ